MNLDIKLAYSGLPAYLSIFRVLPNLLWLDDCSSSGISVSTSQLHPSRVQAQLFQWWSCMENQAIYWTSSLVSSPATHFQYSHQPSSAQCSNFWLPQYSLSFYKFLAYSHTIPSSFSHIQPCTSSICGTHQSDTIFINFSNWNPCFLWSHHHFCFSNQTLTYPLLPYIWGVASFFCTSDHTIIGKLAPQPNLVSRSLWFNANYRKSQGFRFCSPVNRRKTLSNIAFSYHLFWVILVWLWKNHAYQLLVL